MVEKGKSSLKTISARTKGHLPAENVGTFRSLERRLIRFQYTQKLLQLTIFAFKRKETMSEALNRDHISSSMFFGRWPVLSASGSQNNMAAVLTSTSGPQKS